MTIKIRAKAPSPATVERLPETSGGPPQSKDWSRRWLGLVFRTPAPRPAKPAPSEDADANPLMAFGAEGEWTTAPDAIAPRPQPSAKPASAPATHHLHWSTVSGIALTVILAAFGTYVLVRAGWMPLQADSPRPARLTIETQPAGAELLLDGVARGTTPATLSVAAGTHRIILRRGTAERTLPVTLAGGAEVTHHVELASPEAAPIRTGKISIVTDPSGARVHLDGQTRGTTPLILSDVAPSEHKIVVGNANGSAERTVTVEAGATTAVVFSLPKASGPAAGWMAIASPFDVQVLEGDAVVGTGRASKVMLPAGRHEITLANDSLGYRDKRTIEIGAGKTTALKVDPPKRSLSANARPWAEMFVDGASVGQTPIANLIVAIGPHDIVFRHPQLGERQQTVLVTIQGPNRIAVDLTKK
jgi:PEGA domain